MKSILRSALGPTKPVYGLQTSGANWRRRTAVGRRDLRCLVEQPRGKVNAGRISTGCGSVLIVNDKGSY
jgi:hypothetical protein